MASRFRPDGTQVLWHSGTGKLTSSGQACLVKTWLDEEYELHVMYSLSGQGGPWEEAALEDVEPDPECEEFLSDDGHLAHIMQIQETENE